MKVKEFIKQEEQRTPLQERLKLVRKIFHLCVEINEQGKYYVFFDLAPHVFLITFYVTPITDYTKRFYKNCDLFYNCNFKTHEEMLDNLKQAVSKLISYLSDSNKVEVGNDCKSMG